MIPKFRVWDESRNLMIDEIVVIDLYNEYIGYLCSSEIVQGEIVSRLSINDVIIMQSTGLLDRNGVEIYEGDIVKRTYLFNGAYGETHTGEVVYDKEYARYVISRPKKYIEPETEELRNALSDKSTYEVIGNIYENPELLEVE